MKLGRIDPIVNADLAIVPYLGLMPRKILSTVQIEVSGGSMSSVLGLTGQFPVKS